MTDIFWWHSIDLGDRVTPGHKSPERLDWEWNNLHLPPLAGRTLLDIGAWDGYFSFRAEREGASRVVALDHYVWSLDLPKQQAYWRECSERGITPDPYHERPELWHPETLPGRAAFELAHKELASGVEPIVADFMTVDPDAVGVFDVVLFLGVIYHVEEPLAALRRLRSLTGSLAVIESEAITVDDDRSLWELVPGAELNADVGNWWVPTEAGLHALVRAAGFARAETVGRAPVGEDGHYRIFVHASP
jgi:tRNA (mo5U34)-methyltransferase